MTKAEEIPELSAEEAEEIKRHRPSTLNNLVWFRNPGQYIEEAVSCGAKDFIWDAGYLAKFKINPVQFLRSFFGITAGMPWRSITVHREHAVLYTSKSTERYMEAEAVYPVWNYGDESMLELQKLVNKPWGERNPVDFLDFNKGSRPVPGQSHVIVINGLPSANLVETRNFLKNLAEVEAQSDVVFHIHGIYGYSALFGNGFKSIDIDPKSAAEGSSIRLPGGKTILVKDVPDDSQYWIKLLGFNKKELLASKRMRVSYNIKSAQWASVYYTSLLAAAPSAARMNRRTGKSAGIDHFSDKAYRFVQRAELFSRAGIKPQPGDKVACDTCSLWLNCKLYRKGAICIMPDSDMQQVANLFRTRDGRSITEGMGRLLALNAERIEVASLQEAEAKDGINPDLSKLIESTLDRAEKLAKLVDPSMRASGAKISVTVGNQQNNALPSSPQSVTPQVASHIIKEIEATGVPRGEITQEMVEEYIQEQMGNEGVISGELEEEPELELTTISPPEKSEE